MDQCIATTTSGSQCKRATAEDCGPFCRQHFEKLPKKAREAIRRRTLAKKLLDRAQRYGGAAYTIYKVLEKLYEIAGPYLSAREQRLLSEIQRTASPIASRRLVSQLKRSLGTYQP